VVSKDDYEQAKRQALECEEEKIRFIEQRYALQRASSRHAATLSNIIHGSIIQAEYSEENNLKNKALQNKKSNLNEQNLVLLQDLEKAEETVEILENKVLKLEQGKKIVAESWKFSTLQLEETQKEVDNMKISFVELENTLVNRDRELLLLTSQLEEYEKKENEMTHCIITIIKNIDLLLEHYAKSIDQEDDLFTNRDVELQTTLQNFESEIYDHEDEAENAISATQTARFESLLLLTQDLLDDCEKDIQVNKETLLHLKTIRDDLQKLVKVKMNINPAINIEMKYLDPLPSSPLEANYADKEKSSEQQFYLNPSRSKSISPTSGHPNNPATNNNGSAQSIQSRKSFREQNSKISPFPNTNLSSSLSSTSGGANSNRFKHSPLTTPQGSSAATKLFESSNTLGDF
jgi:hypothetical protein